MALGHISASVHCPLLFRPLLPMLLEPKDFLTRWLGRRASVFFQSKKGGLGATCLPSWEGTWASSGACERSEGGSSLPEVNPEQVGMPEKWYFAMLCVGGCQWTKDHSEFLDLFIMSPLQSALISCSHFVFKRALKNLQITQLLLKLTDWILNTLSLIQMWKNLKYH